MRGDLILNEAEAARWLTREELWSVAWLPADETIIEEVGERMRRVVPHFLFSKNHALRDYPGCDIFSIWVDGTEEESLPSGFCGM